MMVMWLYTCKVKSPLARGEWIEIAGRLGGERRNASPLARGEWIEMFAYSDNFCKLFSLPSHEGSGLKLQTGEERGAITPSPLA